MISFFEHFFLQTLSNKYFLAKISQHLTDDEPPFLLSNGPAGVVIIIASCLCLVFKLGEAGLLLEAKFYLQDPNGQRLQFRDFRTEGGRIGLGFGIHLERQFWLIMSSGEQVCSIISNPYIHYERLEIS
jgi:hypothetical protein